jgi:hypothetical protein
MPRRKNSNNGTNGLTTTGPERMVKKIATTSLYLTALAERWGNWPEDAKGYVQSAVADLLEASKALAKAETKLVKLPPEYSGYQGRAYIPLMAGAIVAVSENTVEKFLSLGFKQSDLKKMTVISAQVNRGGGRVRVKTPSGVEMVIPRIQLTVVEHATE